MNKLEIVREISAKTGIEKKDVSITLEAFFQTVKNKMIDGENIYIRGFGSFINKKRAAKKGRNITKNIPVIIKSHYIPFFKPVRSFIGQIKNSGKVIIANQKLKRKSETIC